MTLVYGGAPKEYKYCRKCGAKNIRLFGGVRGFDPETGRGYKRVKIVCPNKRWALDGHSSATLTDEPEPWWHGADDVGI